HKHSHTRSCTPTHTHLHTHTPHSQTHTHTHAHHTHTHTKSNENRYDTNTHAKYRPYTNIAPDHTGVHRLRNKHIYRRSHLHKNKQTKSHIWAFTRANTRTYICIQPNVVGHT